MPGKPFVLKAAVEGIVDEVVLKAVLRDLGADAHPIYGKNGKKDLFKKIKNYNRAAQYEPWIILVDLDNEFDCAPLLCEDWLKEPASKLCFRVAVRSIESWLLADRERISTFFGISISKVPENPDLLQDPKQTMVNLARKSRRTIIKSDMVPSLKGGRKVGPAYTSRLIEFVTDPRSRWRPSIAANRSNSLQRCFEAIRTLKGA